MKSGFLLRMNGLNILYSKEKIYVSSQRDPLLLVVSEVGVY